MTQNINNLQSLTNEELMERYNHIRGEFDTLVGNMVQLNQIRYTKLSNDLAAFSAEINRRNEEFARQQAAQNTPEVEQE